MHHSRPINMHVFRPCRLSIVDSLNRDRGKHNSKVSCIWLDICFTVAFLLFQAQNIGLIIKGYNDIGKTHNVWQWIPQHYLYKDGSTLQVSYLVGYAWTGWTQSGYVYTHPGAAIAWRSKKQSNVAFSSIEAKYVLVSLAAKEAARCIGQVHTWRDESIRGSRNNPLLQSTLYQTCLYMSDNIHHADIEAKKHHGCTYHDLAKVVHSLILRRYKSYQHTSINPYVKDIDWVLLNKCHMVCTELDVTFSSCFGGSQA